MMPIGPLMIEHRLIERMIALMAGKVRKMKENRSADTEFILTAVDFIKTYADKLHHGKEENILFRDLKKKPLSAAHNKMIDDFVSEHNIARGHTKAIADSLDRHIKGGKGPITEIISNIEFLVSFYPVHIEKEDRHFFIPVMEYFSKEEQASMLNEFTEFDRKFIHNRYDDKVSGLERRG